MEAVSVIWGRVGCGLIVFALTSAAVMAEPEQSVSHFSTDEWLINTWENEDGPPEYTATAMAQSADGFLWFGTFGGLERFDGVKLTSFNKANTPQLPSDGIVNLHLDARGWLWISTYGGLVVHQDKQWRAFGTNDGWAGNYVRTFAERTNGDLLITTFDGHVLDFSNGRLNPLPPPPGEPEQGYQAHVDESGRWWVVQNRFIGLWDGERWLPMVSVGNLGADAVGRGKARDGGLWVLLGKELRKYREGKEVSRRQFTQDFGGIWDLFEDSRGNVWISSYNKGLSQVTANGEVHRWTTTNGLPADGVRFVFEDSERNLWIGTSGGGLTRFKQRRVRSLGREQGLAAGAHSVCSDPAGGLWVGTYGGGLFRWSDAGLTNVSPTGISKAVTYLQCVLKDSAGRLWLSTFLHGLWLVEQETARPIPPEQTGGNNVIALFEDSRGRVWIGGGGARVAVCEGRRFRCVREESRMAQGVVSCFAEDRQGAIWFTDEAGVFRLENDRFVEVRTRENQPVKGINCLKVDSEGNVWMGSLDRGLLRWRDGQWAKVDQESGLPRGAIYSMIEDKESVLWMVTEAGIARAARTNLNAVANGTSERLVCQVLDRSDGLSSMAFSAKRQPACACDLSGRLWFATGRGLAMIDPGGVHVSTSAPLVHIESIVYHETERRAGAASETEIRLSAPFPERVVLPAGSRRIEIAYTAPSFAAPEKVRFQVKLEGRDPDWQDSANRRTAYLYEIPPGNYVFRVRAANNDGIVNEAGARLAFIVLPFFWQTSWFRGLIGFAVLGEAGLIIGLLANRRKLNRIQADLVESERRMNLAGHAARLGMWVWEIGQDEVWITEDGRKLFGWTKAEVPNFERFMATLYPEDREPTRAAVRSALEGHGDYEAEYRVMVATGSTRWVAARGQVEFNGEGKPIRMRGVSIDITARKQAEDKFRLAVEASPNGIVMVDRQGSIVLANAQTEKMFGYERNELVGQPVEILVPHRFREHHPGHRGGFFAHPQARSMGAGRELFARRKDGSEFPVEIGLSPIQAAEGLLVLTAVVDITARKQAEAEAQRQRAELAHVARVSTMGELAASLAHELSQPLGAILSNAEAAEMILNQSPPALQEVREILCNIRKDDERAGEVIRRMRALLRKREMELLPLDLNSVMEDLFRLVSGDAALRKTAISAELSPGLPAVRGDRIHLQQVLLNLTINAMEAMSKQPPEKRSLTMRTRLNGNRTVEVAVMDSGAGIEPNKLPWLFEPFFTTKPTGMGMGLSIARAIIEAHRGHISAENNESGGATFRVALPVATEESKQ